MSTTPTNTHELLEAPLTADALLIGETTRSLWPNTEQVPLGLSADVRSRHVHLVGMTGTGKSVLMSRMIAHDLAAGAGVGILDPHGSLAEATLSLVPVPRFQNVIYFNPADHERPIGFNPLEGATPETAPRITETVLSAFVSFFGKDAIMDQSQDLLRNALRAVLDLPSPTLLDVLRIIEDKSWRRTVTEHLTDPLVHYYWTSTVPEKSERAWEEMTRAITNKLRRVLTNPVCRNIIGQRRSTVSLRRVMDERMIFIANLDIGQLGEGVSALLGALLSAEFAAAAFQRSDTPEEQRTQFFLYEDEFQNFATGSFATILSQLRKYNLSLTIAHQYREQLPDALESAVFGNAATTIAFRLGAEDAKKFSQHLMLDASYREAELKGHEQLAALPNRQAFAKTLDGDVPG